MTTDLREIGMATPLMNAAGTLSKENAARAARVWNYGALVTKSVTLEPRDGNPPPRLAEAPCGMLNSIGLENPGIEAFLEKDLDEWGEAGLPVIVSVWGAKSGEYGRLCMALRDDDRVAAIELNLSCPNVSSETYSSRGVGEIVNWCWHRTEQKKPLIAKLGLNNHENAAYAAQAWRASAVTLINTVPGLTWHPDAPEPFLGGLSGRAIKPLALRAVYEAACVVDIPVIGCGGVMGEGDAAQFLRCGAKAAQVGSGSFVRDVAEKLEG